MDETKWPVVGRGGSAFHNLMKVNASSTVPAEKNVHWMLVKDEQNTANTCAFWNGIAQDITKQMEAAGGEGIDADDESIDEEL
ncbi:hypothetical protein H9L39_17444 [Fusarium oxysporum f. sp. albedinis]|nr:hypothetical protein H9L39_17444 [Fusarium oxysporum f. sp. albedinis]